MTEGSGPLYCTAVGLIVGFKGTPQLLVSPHPEPIKSLRLCAHVCVCVRVWCVCVCGCERGVEVRMHVWAHMCVCVHVCM